MLTIVLTFGCAPQISELIHDPSQLVLRADGALTLASSGTEGAGMLTWVVDPQTGEFNRDEEVFGDEIGAVK